MLYRLYRYWNFTAKPVFLGWLVKCLISRRGVKIGKNFRVHGIPSVNIDNSASVVIGDNVELRRDVELRAHGSSCVAIGNNIRIDRGVRILAANSSKIQISDGVRIGLYSVLNGGDSISIGAKSLISGFVYLQTSMHRFENLNESVADQGFRHAPVELGEDVWLGAHVVVMPGVKIGSSAIVGSNAVVTTSVDSYSIVGGVPAKVISNRC